VVEWPRLVGVLCKHDVRPDKDGRLWSPVAYGAAKARKAANVAAVSCLVLDIDTLVAPALLAKRWEDQGLEFVIHSTHSSSLEAPKWRAIFPLAAPVPATEWKDTLRKLTLHLAGGNADPSCKDVSRMFYLPSCPPEHVSARIARHHAGRPLDPAAVPEPAPELVEKAEGERRRAVLPAGARGDYRTLDAVALFTAHGLYGRELEAGKHAVLCPWVHEHTEQREADFGDTVIWEAAGGAWPTFFCSHSHCAGRGMADVIAKLGDADRYCAQEFAYRPRPGVPAGAMERIAALVAKAQAARKAGERPDAAEVFDLARDLAGLAEADPVAYGKARAQLKAAFGDLLSLRDLDRAILAAKPAPAPKPSKNGKAHPLSDYGNAERLVDRDGADLRYCEAWAKWFVWDGSRWAVDRTGEVMRRAKGTVRALYHEAAEIADDNQRQAYNKHIAKSESEKGLRAMIALAQSEPAIPILPEELDTDPMLLACENGTLDLATGELHPHRREDRITRRVPVIFDPDATCPTVDQFIADIFGGDPDMVSYIYRALGYAITGSVKERVLFILWGAKGNNGKTTLLELLADVLCDYSAKVKADTLMVKHGEGGIPNDIARLKGARFVFASEGEENRRLAEALVKEITGGDTITARFMRGEWFDIRPEFKVFFATNHRPVIRGTDPAIWKRLHLIPFVERFVEEPAPGEHPIDKDLPAKLRAELPGFLAKIVRGCLEWQRMGLCPPEKVQAATEAYRGEMDTMADWLAECCVVTPQAQATPSALYASYAEWCDAAGEHPCTMKAFSMRLQERGFVAERTKHQRLFKGIGLLARDSGDGFGVVTGGDGRSGISSMERDREDYTEIPVTTRHPAQPVTPDPVDALWAEAGIGACACGRPADRFTPTGEPICSECAGERGA
jgi:putative DNA primase/helicase